MTIIVWDGFCLAADKRAVLGTLIRTTTKIFKVRNHLLGYAGDADAGEEMLAWFKDGADPGLFPTNQREDDRWSGLLVIGPDKRIFTYERTPHPLKFHDEQFAIGCGRDFALAAMYLGQSAPEAVKVACAFDYACGNGVDVLYHDGE